MKIKKYVGQTAHEAMLKLKMELGPDAVVLNTKTIRPKGLFRYFKKPLVEITAAFEDKDLLNNVVMKLYEINEYERRAIQETLDLNLDYYNRKQNSAVLRPPTNKMLDIYKSTITSILKASFGNNTYFNIQMHDYNGPLLIAEIQLSENNQKNKLDMNNKNGKEILESLNKKLIEQKSQSVYVKRNVKFYDRESIFLIKPRMKLYWSTVAAMYDADNIYMDIMRSWRGAQ